MSHYIPLEYDRSHLLLTKKTPQTGVVIDHYDIALIVINMLALIAILVYYLSISYPTKAFRSEPMKKLQ